MNLIFHKGFLHQPQYLVTSVQVFVNSSFHFECPAFSQFGCLPSPQLLISAVPAEMKALRGSSREVRTCSKENRLCPPEKTEEKKTGFFFLKTLWWASGRGGPDSLRNSRTRSSAKYSKIGHVLQACFSAFSHRFPSRPESSPPASWGIGN